VVVWAVVVWAVVVWAVTMMVVSSVKPMVMQLPAVASVVAVSELLSRRQGLGRQPVLN
jgi:hypothetical protein